jgi:CIC family chloride channel protein
MIGGAVGGVAHQLFPTWTANPGAYALVGMGTAFAGIVRTPLTSVIMIFEMTRDYSIIVPLMISNLVAFFVSYKLQRQPVYEALAHQEGVFLPGAEDREHLARMQVFEATEKTAIQAGAGVSAALEQLKEAGQNSLPVIDGNKLVGIVTQAELEASASRGATSAAAAIGPNAPVPYVHGDQPLALALEKMGAASLDSLPVVSRADVCQFLGTVTLSDVLGAYGLKHRPQV